MPRSLRILHPGAWYHVTSRGIERRPIYRDRRDRLHFLELMGEMVDRFRLTLHAFVLMENHYHLLLELAQPNLSRALQWLNLSHSVWFNRRHQRCGYLFQGRFKSIVVEPQSWALSLSGYIHLNPVRVAKMGLGKSEQQRARQGAGELPQASLVQQRILTLRSYPWSSYPAYLGLGSRPRWLECDRILELAGGPVSRQRASYRKYVEDQIRQGLPLKPWDQLRDQIFLGSGQFLRKVKKQIRTQLAPEAAQAKWLRQPVKLEQVIAAVEQERGQSWTDFKDKHSDRGRDLVLYLARKATLLTVSELARAMKLKQHGNVSMAVKRYQVIIQQDVKERAVAKRAAQMLYVTL